MKLSAILALALAAMGVHANNATNATGTTSAAPTVAATTAAATTNGTAATTATTAAATTGTDTTKTDAGNTTATGYTATLTVSASMVMPNGTTVADLAAGTTAVAKALRASLEKGFATAAGLTAAEVSIASIKAGARRQLDELRRLTATALEIDYVVAFKAGATAADVNAFASKVSDTAFAADFTAGVATAVEADTALTTACASGCGVTGGAVKAGSLKFTKDGATETLANIKAEAAASDSSTPGSNAMAKFSGLGAVAFVLSMMA